MAKLADSAEVVSIQITDPAEKQIVDKYGVSRAPMPLVLAVAPCGAITKAFTKAFDENQLRTAFVSPCTQVLEGPARPQAGSAVRCGPSQPASQPVTIPKGVQDFTADQQVRPSDGDRARQRQRSRAKRRSSRTFRLIHGTEAGHRVPGSSRPVIGKFDGMPPKQQLVAKLESAQSESVAPAASAVLAVVAPRSKENESMRLVVELSLAVMLGLGMTIDAKAASPTEGSAPTASRAATALETAAKDNKYLFIFFFDKARRAHQCHERRLSGGDGEDDRSGRFDGDQRRGPRRKADCGQVRRARGSHAAGVGDRSYRGCHPAFPRQFDEAQLQQAFVSPCTAKCMKAIQDRHMILLCVQNGKTQFNQEAMQGVEAFKADPQYAKATEIVMLNPADKAEQQFLKDLQVDPRTTTAVTVLVTPPGAPVARFAGAVTKEQIDAKVKEAESSCGPGCSCHH